MSTAVAAPFQQSSNFGPQYHNMSNSPTQPTTQRNTRPPRARNVNINNDAYAQNTQSDSGLPSQATTPKPKKTRPRQNDHRAASNSDVPNSTNQRTKPSRKSPTATPAKPAAYAGPTFHASPAASNLPMPKFASKSVPPATTNNSLQAKFDAESRKLNAPSPSFDAAVPAPLSRERSPLDIFFNADRQERAHKSSSPLAQRRTTPPEAKGMFKLDIDPSISPAASQNQAEADKHAYTQSLKNLLNLQPSTTSPAQPRAQPNPVFQTPQQQRTLDADPSLHYGNRSLTPLFHAARNPSSPQPTADLTPKRNPSAHAQQPFDPRAYLESQSPFISRPHNASASPQQHYQQQPYHSPAQFIGAHRPQPPPPQRPSQPDHSPDVKGMEAKLRGMLKLT